MRGFEAKCNPPGWWKISVSLKNLKKLDEIKQKLEAEKNERLSYNKVIQHLIESYKGVAN